MFHSDGQRESSVIRKIYFWAIIVLNLFLSFSVPPKTCSRRTLGILELRCEQLRGSTSPPLTKALTRRSRSSRGSSLVLLMIFSIKPANGPSNRWCGHTGLNALAVTVNRFTGGSQIGHFVMAITLRLAALRWLMPELTRAARFPSPHVEVLARELVLDLLPQPVEQQRPHRRPQLGAVPT